MGSVVIGTSTGTTMPAPYMGVVATRGGVPNATDTNNKSAQDMTVHFATDEISRVKLVFMNAYVNGTFGSSTFAEVAGTGTVERQASIEPDLKTGTRYQFLFNGVATGTAAVGQLVETDWLDLPAPIPPGAMFRTRNRHTGSERCFVTGDQGLRTLGGEGIEIGATTTDKTMSGTIAATSGAVGSSVYRSPPVAVLGMTRKGTIVVFGNSRGRGVKDTGDGRGVAGSIDRSLDGIGLLNASVGGDRLTVWLANSTLRRQLAAYTSHVACMDSINDTSQASLNRTTAQFLADAASFAALFPNQKVLFPVTQPFTTGTFADLAGQTVDGGESKRLAVNTAIRNLSIAGQSGWLDVCSGVEDFASGKWKPNAAADGLHESQVGALGTVAQRCIHRDMVSR